MNKFLLFLGAALWVAGCARQAEVQPEAIALFYAAEEASKTDALAEGDEVFVSASVEGTGNYFLENSRWTVGPDGKALVPAVPVFYPDPKEAVAFYAYFGAQHVPTDQSAPADLKKADLCWASASSTPSHTTVPLTFSHVFARLAVTCSVPTSKILVSNAFSGGSLDIRSGAFANSTKSDIVTTGNELVVPAQTLNRLIVTSGGVDYVFDGSIALESGKTTTANLTLNTSTHTATLAGSSVSAWATQSAGGNLSQAVSNVLSLQWPNFIQQGTLPDKVVLTINGSDYTVSSGITYANQTFTVPFASSALRYPYTVTKITFYSGSTQSLPACTQLLGATIYKSAAQTIGLKDQTNAIKIGNLWWAKGNLVAAGVRGAGGQGAAKIGEPNDAGLYFQFGSLIGWKGGAVANGGSGAGAPQGVSGTYWNGASSLSWANDAYLWPTEMGGNPTGVIGWPQSTNNQWYFGLVSGWNTSGQNIRDYTGFVTGLLANAGVGDPCTYYLGVQWRSTTTADWVALAGGRTGMSWVSWGTSGFAARWATVGQIFGGVSGPGAWFGPGLNANGGTPDITKNIFFPISGNRGYNAASGEFWFVNEYATYGTTSIYDQSSTSYNCHMHPTAGMIPQNAYGRVLAFPVRCVIDAI